MKPNSLNCLCAQPSVIAGTVGAVVLDLAVCIGITDEIPSFTANFASGTLLPTVIGFSATTALGALFGFMFCFPFVSRLCRSINGAQLAVGNTVIVLSGPTRGTIATVYEITVGQGGKPLGRINLGAEQKAKSMDLFAEYSLFIMATAEGPLPGARE